RPIFRFTTPTTTSHRIHPSHESRRTTLERAVKATLPLLHSGTLRGLGRPSRPRTVDSTPILGPAHRGGDPAPAPAPHRPAPGRRPLPNRQNPRPVQLDLAQEN